MLKIATASTHVDPDSELVVRVQHGDSNAFEELVNRHRGRVYRTLISITGNHHEAQDAAQETFLKAFEHIADFERRSKFSTWLLTIASNNALQRIRDTKSLESIDDVGIEAKFRPRHVPGWLADPEKLYSLAERCGLLERGLMNVPSKYREVLVLRYLEELSAEEAAKVLGVRVSAIKARLFRGRIMLRSALVASFRQRIYQNG